MKKTTIITGYTCNNNCVFCYDEEKRNKGIPDLKTSEVKQRLVSAKKQGCDYVDFIGGEFTIRKDALELVRYAKELGFKTIAITTNGRLFSYADILQKFMDAGTNSIIYSVHGHDAKLHDMQTQVPGSFKQLMKAIKNTKNLGMMISTNTTITRYNYKQLPKIAQFLYDLGVRNAEFPFLDPTTGKGNTNFAGLMPKVSKAGPYIAKALDVGKKAKEVKHWHVRYFPLCHIKGYEDQSSESTSSFEREMHFGPEFTNIDVESSRKTIGRAKADSCKECIWDKRCEGLWKKYAEVYGTKELRKY